MIISRTPFRISFVGGGSDLESYYKFNGGSVISTTIDKYIYLSSHQYFDYPSSILKYSKTEIITNSDEIEHPIIKNVFNRFNLKGIDFNSIADIPSGTGMGSSSAFTVGLINLFCEKNNINITKMDLAEMACDIEIKDLGEPIGKQDQYAAVFGGLNVYKFGIDGKTTVHPVSLKTSDLVELESNLFLVYTGIRRSASAVLNFQNKEMVYEKKRKVIDSMVSYVEEFRNSILNGTIDDIGNILHECWLLKKSISSSVTDASIDEIYHEGLRLGASGGKLLGAGAGGFILFYVPICYHQQFSKKFRTRIFPFKFDNSGSKIIFNDEK
jgi:D-glycero-alpha-D-manno-heptose-7-phosphate kinase